jgi:hypothetical protein
MLPATLLLGKLANGILLAFLLHRNKPIYSNPRSLHPSNPFFDPFKIANLAIRELGGYQGFSATFQASISGCDLEYTVWHNPILNLTLLRSLYATIGNVHIMMSLPDFSLARELEVEFHFLTDNMPTSVMFGLDRGLVSVQSFGREYIPGQHYFASRAVEEYLHMPADARLDALATAVAINEAFSQSRQPELEEVLKYN